jgi:sugar phosphate isomerase/epimerase
MTMFPSACIWDYPAPMKDALKQIKETAFHYIDIEPNTLEPEEALSAYKELGLEVSCVALDHKLPSGCSLDGKNQASMRKAIAHMKAALQKCQALEAKAAYLGPCSDPRQLQAFGAALNELAEAAAEKNIKLCVEHVWKRALPTAKEVVSFLKKLNHRNLYLLLDIGHSLMAGEKPSAAALEAGDRLGYIQMNDNDGKNDKHWPLLDGVLTLDELAKTMDALKQVGYEGTIGLELSSKIPSLISGFSRNRNLILRLQETEEPLSLKEPETRRKQ